MSEKPGKLPTGPGSRESANNLDRAIESSDIAASCKAIGVVSHRHDISDIAKKPGLKDRLYRALQAAQRIQTLRLS
jgi:DNA-binding phage protein